MSYTQLVYSCIDNKNTDLASSVIMEFNVGREIGMAESPDRLKFGEVLDSPSICGAPVTAISSSGIPD